MAVSDAEIEEAVESWTWHDIKPYVGYTIVVPNAPFYETGSAEANLRKRWTDLWLRKLQRAVGTMDANLRVVLQPERTDHFGFPLHLVILWSDYNIEETEVFRVRGVIEEAGYHVSSISVHYDPPMA